MTQPTHLNCKDCVDRLGDFVDRELSTEEVAAVERHLEECFGCAREFRFEGAVLESIKVTLRRVQAPASLLEKIRRSLDS
ncbi:MAG TPA: zf-HC2 domain-containing protein [Gemmatimonadales bacterium]|nr:zf-HC2 domain-containing protein [Gemmatimonadales bacterium]